MKNMQEKCEIYLYEKLLALDRKANQEVQSTNIIRELHIMHKCLDFVVGLDISSIKVVSVFFFYFLLLFSQQCALCNIMLVVAFNKVVFHI